MQCKDIPDKPILEFLAKHPNKYHNWCFNDEYCITHAMPKDIPNKLIIIKMKSLIAKKLVTGCDCGCRGDYTITDEGLKSLNY